MVVLKHVLLSPLFGKDFPLDLTIIFFRWVEATDLFFTWKEKHNNFELQSFHVLDRYVFYLTKKNIVFFSFFRPRLVKPDIHDYDMS